MSRCYFLWNNEIRILKDAGPIGLSFMVVLSESYVQNLENKAISEALTVNITPKTFRRYVDDSHARFDNKETSQKFQELLNKQDQQIQYTIEYEDENKCLNFLDTKIKNIEGKYEFNVYCKLPNKTKHTNVQIKPNSSIPLNKVFSKDFLLGLNL